MDGCPRRYCDVLLVVNRKKASSSWLSLVSNEINWTGNVVEGDKSIMLNERYCSPGVGPRHRHSIKRHRKYGQRRVVHKNGDCNISRINIQKRRRRFLADIFTTLVDIKWRWNLVIFVLAFTMSWVIFSVLWWLICFAHGDFENRDNPEWKRCVEEVYDFPTALLFSIETQQTIGFGSRRTNPYCMEAIAMVMIQSGFGMILQALMTGLIFVKLSRPKKRVQTLLFSKNAVISKRDDSLCLLFRVGDMRKSHIVDTHIRAILIKRHVTLEGEVLPLWQRELAMNPESEGRLFLVWPIIVEHRKKEESPLWDLAPDDLHKENFEIIVVLEGIVESTGMTAQARTSYLPGEIIWGHRFERLVSFHKESGIYVVDYSRFHSTVPVDIPEYSAHEMSMSLFQSDTSDDEHISDGDSASAATLSTLTREKVSSIRRLSALDTAALAAYDIGDEKPYSSYSGNQLIVPS